MNILALCPGVPAADAKGYQVLGFYRLRHLARQHQVHVICFGHGEADEMRKKTLEALGISVQMLRWQWAEAIRYGFAALFDDRMPFQCALFSSNRFRHAVKYATQNTRVDAVYGITIRILPNIVEQPGRLLLDLVDSMALNFSRRMEKAHGVNRWLLGIEHVRVAAYEKAAALGASACFVVSNVDQRKIGEANVQAIPLGIDTTRFGRLPSRDAPPVVAFTGNMGYQPNIEAVLWFTKNCWPAVRHAVPDARLVVAGSNPVPAIRALASDGSISVTGRVVSIADVLHGSQVAVAPMQSGSGMQFKILEAMACGLPVVATMIGKGDIAATDGTEIALADAAADFAFAVSSLLQSPSRRKVIGDGAQCFVRTNHSWEVLNERFARRCRLSEPGTNG